METTSITSGFLPIANTIASVSQFIISTYAVYLSYVSITNTKPYESKTQKVAKYSNTANDQLNQTRTTLAAGTVAVHSFPYAFPLF